METMTEPFEHTHATRLTEYDRNVLYSTATDLLLLRDFEQGILTYCNLVWSIPMNKYYLTGRQVRCMAFVLEIAFQHISELSEAGKSQECFDLSVAIKKLPLFVHRDMEWEEVLTPLRAYKEQYPETSFDYAKVLVGIRDKPTKC